MPSHFHCSFSTNPHKALHPFTKSPLAVTSALNSSSDISGMLLFVLGLLWWKVVPVLVPLYLSHLPPPPYLLLPQQQPTQHSQHVHHIPNTYITFPTRTSNASTSHTPTHHTSTSDSSGPYRDEDVLLSLQHTTRSFFIYFYSNFYFIIFIIIIIETNSNTTTTTPPTRLTNVFSLVERFLQVTESEIREFYGEAKEGVG